MNMGVAAGALSVFFGLGAAGLWFKASRIGWTMARERGMTTADFGPRRGKWWAETYYVDQEPYLKAVGYWNGLAAIATAVSVLCQTLAGLVAR
jgi:hypothetical protein